MAVEEFAPAKINLCLHVTGQRADGYHLLDSLVVFAGVGDRLRLALADRLSLRCTGRFGAALDAGPENLVLRAAGLFPPRQAPAGAAITLDKALPLASGIGGGSADAAATLRGLSRLWGLGRPGPAQVLGLGADVPVCLEGRPCRMSGIGETIAPLPPLPPLWLVLANPGVAVPTPAVFRALGQKDNPGLPALPARFADAGDFCGFLAAQRNDLQAPAIALQPVIETALTALAAQKGAMLTRMSGSGATVFALFAARAEAEAAAAALARGQPGWWTAAAPLLGPPGAGPATERTPGSRGREDQA